MGVPRDFLYLDISMVDEWLSQQQGGLLEGPYSHKEINSNEKEGDGSVRIPATPIGVGGKFNVATSLEVVGTYRETPESKFDRLYKLLDGDNTIQKLITFDVKRLETVRLGQIFEVAGKARLTGLERLSITLASFDQLRKQAQAWGVNILDAQDEQKFQAATELVSTDESKGTLLIIKPDGPATGGLKYLARLKPVAIRVSKDDLEGDIIMLGKFIEEMTHDQTKPVKDLLPHLVTMQVYNHDQRRKLAKEWRKASDNTPFGEVISGPALVFRPLAIYQ